MARDLNDIWGWIKRLVRRIERLESGAFLESSSITKGRMRFIGGTLRIDSGGRAEIVGTLQVDGSTIVTGTFRLEGNWTFTGDGTITGKLTQNGPWEFNGAGQIKGNVDMTGNLNVTGGGKIQAGSIVLNPSSNGGAIQVGTHVIDGRSGALGFYAFNHFIVLNDGGVSIVTASGKSVVLGAIGIQLGGLPTVSRGAANNAVVGTVWSDTAGNLYRVVT